MIKSFRHGGLQAFYETGSKAGIRPDHAPRLKRILGVLDTALLLGQAMCLASSYTSSVGF
ncbi:MAG: hypothetical protein ACYC2R_15275 [Burkholderiales bacterium]